MASKPVDSTAAYKRQLKRIKGYVNKLEKEGYNVNLDFSNLKQPKKVTAKSVERLKKITPVKIRQRAFMELPDGRRRSAQADLNKQKNIKRKAKSKSANQLEFERQVKRVKNAIYRLEKEGYKVDKSQFDLTAPNRITKTQIERLKAIKPITLRKASTIYVPTMGEISGQEYYKMIQAGKAYSRKKAREEKKKKENIIDIVLPDDEIPQDWEIALGRIRERIAEFDTHGATLLNEMLASQIKNYGEKAVGRAIYNLPPSFWTDIDIILYYDDDLVEKAKVARNIAMAITGEILSQELNEAFTESTNNWNYM